MVNKYYEDRIASLKAKELIITTQLHKVQEEIIEVSADYIKVIAANIENKRREL